MCGQCGIVCRGRENGLIGLNGLIELIEFSEDFGGGNLVHRLEAGVSRKSG